MTGPLSFNPVSPLGEFMNTYDGFFVISVQETSAMLKGSASDGATCKVTTELLDCWLLHHSQGSEKPRVFSKNPAGRGFFGFYWKNPIKPTQKTHFVKKVSLGSWEYEKNIFLRLPLLVRVVMLLYRHTSY
jgi:hypothetical protein